MVLYADEFKMVNDMCGHQQGDVVLREVARVLLGTSREIDHPAPPAIGDEPAVVVPETDLDGAVKFTERLRERIGDLRNTRLDRQGELAGTASCGVAAVPPVVPDSAALEASADGALYEAKHAGKKNKTVRASRV